ncbi:MAG TPA: hypothetical protein VFI25_06235 [Planctomycetota bacterium]|jgi:hypothetical protein|nr:hypothetical protein [Planctomycetota bacterium]
MIPTLLLSIAPLSLTQDAPPVRVRVEKAASPTPPNAPSGIRVEQTARGKEVVVESGIPLADLVTWGGVILGRVYTWRQDSEPVLRGTPVKLTSPQSVPIADFEPWLEGVLLTQDFVTILPPEGSLEPVLLVNLRGADRSMLPRSALFVPAEEVPRFRHPGTLIRTAVPLTYLDAQRAAVNLRPFFTDPHLESISPLGSSNGVVIQGFPRTVSTLIAILKIGDAGGLDGARLPVLERLPEAAGEKAGATPFEIRLRRLEEASEAFQAAIRNLAAESRR